MTWVYKVSQVVEHLVIKDNYNNEILKINIHVHLTI
jgi:hypothetical protein